MSSEENKTRKISKRKDKRTDKSTFQNAAIIYVLIEVLRKPIQNENIQKISDVYVKQV